MSIAHHCECHALQPPQQHAVLKLAISPDAAHIARQFNLLLQVHALPFQQQANAIIIDVDHLEGLYGLLTGMSEADAQGLRALPVTSQGLQPFELKPLRLWVEQLRTDWFPEVSSHLVFHAQPIAQTSDGQVFGYEALVRAQIGGKLYGAGELLGAASAHGQARAFDALARTTAIRQLYPALRPGQHLFINFAPGVIYNPDVCLQATFQACRDVEADFSRLVFEVTEGETFPDLTLLRSILERYRQEGAQVALDDLGSGHTSLSHLTELRPDIVKLDRALIQGLQHAAPRRRLVAALTNYAHDLGTRVVAEGIEEAEELEILLEIGVDLVQGYYLGRPAAPPRGLDASVLQHWSRDAR